MTTVSTTRSPQSNSPARNNAVHGAGPLQPLQNKTIHNIFFAFIYFYVYEYFALLGTKLRPSARITCVFNH